jgi:hypothetical protein
MANPDALIIGAIVAPLPIAAASYPNVGGFISRKGNRLRLIGAGILIGVAGYAAAVAHLVSAKTGFYFWAPVWQIVVVQSTYYVWYKLFKRAPVKVVLNWDTDIFEDRILAMAIFLLGILVPVFVIGR